MSPTSRVGSWLTTPTSPNRRKRSATPPSNAHSSRKMRRLDNGRGERAEEEEEEEEDEGEGDEEDNEGEGDEEDKEDPEDRDSRSEDDDSSSGDEVMKDDDDLSSMYSGSPIAEYFFDQCGSEVEVDQTQVLDHGEYHATPTKRKSTLPEEHETFGVSSGEMRAEGWDDDYITLAQKIKLRGYEPLMPQSWRFSLRSMPDALFAPTDDAFISSIRNEQFRAEKALEKLLELGGQVRDSMLVESPAMPEAKARHLIELYQKWATHDSGLDPHTTIPVLVLETKPASTPTTELQRNVNRRLARIAARFRDAFRVLESTEEGSPASKASTQYYYPLPTLYAIVASHTIIALMAYKPDDPTPDATPIAFFDMTNSNYDVWNALALSIMVCHARDVQVRIADDTGLGQKVPGRKSRASAEDPDL
jgi:hypothetical protein